VNMPLRTFGAARASQMPARAAPALGALIAPAA
jgi:hypothetical protein